MDAQVVVIGGGLAGAMAALAARAAGRSVALVSKGAGATHVSPGVIDLHPPAWPGGDGLSGTDRTILFSNQPGDHPYRLLSGPDLAGSIAQATRHLHEALEPSALLAPSASLPRRLATMAGALKETDVCQRGHEAGDLRGLEGRRVLLIGFDTLPTFAPRFLAASLGAAADVSDRGRGLRLEATLVAFPQEKARHTLTPFHHALALDQQDVLPMVARSLLMTTALTDFDALGFPPVLGLRAHARAVGRLSELLEKPVFELLPLVPSVPGLRLAEALDAALDRAGVARVTGQVLAPSVTTGRVREVLAAHGATHFDVRGRTFVLATGKFLAGGLTFGATLAEPTFGLPVWLDGEPVTAVSPAALVGRHPLDTHPLLRAGVRVGRDLRPLGLDDRPVFENLFAAGEILSGLDPTRGPCATGACLLTGDLAGRQGALAA
jgi:glycerol-3-phosphate dehydrogenase subunit B